MGGSWEQEGKVGGMRMAAPLLDGAYHCRWFERRRVDWGARW